MKRGCLRLTLSSQCPLSVLSVPQVLPEDNAIQIRRRSPCAILLVENVTLLSGCDDDGTQGYSLKRLIRSLVVCIRNGRMCRRSCITNFLFSARCRAVLTARAGFRSDRSGRLPFGSCLLKKINASSPGVSWVSSAKGPHGRSIEEDWLVI